MTGEEFVKLCRKEKDSMMQIYFTEDSGSEASRIINDMVQTGTNKEDLYRLINTVLTDTYYTLLLGIDGACSLGDKQIIERSVIKLSIILSKAVIQKSPPVIMNIYE